MIHPPPDRAQRKPYIGPSEAQSAAMAGPTQVAPQTDRRYLEENWRSRSRRRRGEPPSNIDGLVAWYREQWEMELPEALHASDTWVDHVSAKERVDGVQPVGASVTGAQRFTAGFRQWLEESPVIRDRDMDLIRPLAASLSALRHETRHGHDVLIALTWGYFDWRDLVGKHFYLREHRHGDATRWCSGKGCRDDVDVTESRRTVVLVMPEDVLEIVIKAALTRLWYLLAEREPHISAVD